MPLRQITGYLYLAFAAFFVLGQSLALFDGRLFATSSLAINFVLAAAAAVAGIGLLKARTRACVALAGGVCGRPGIVSNQPVDVVPGGPRRVGGAATVRF